LSKVKAIKEAASIVDELCDNYSASTLAQVASSLFNITLEFNPRTKFTAAEDEVITTFFYLSSKEELCELLETDMASLYTRARLLGVVNPTFDTLTASDLAQAKAMFETGYSRAEVLAAFGVYDIPTVIPSINLETHREINSLIKEAYPRQMELF